MSYELKYSGAPELYRVAVEVPKVERKVNLVNGMIHIMKYYRGQGLAAPQVGISQRLIVIRFGDDFQEIINPVITKRYGGQSTQVESCLSFLNQNTKVKRYRRVKVEGFDLDWQPVHLKLCGLDARCVQHEVDHLNGITIF